MWVRWTRCNVVAKIKFEALIEFQAIAKHVDDMNLHIAFRIDHTARYEIFDQEVIGYHEP